jgi:hypothetical protein
MAAVYQINGVAQSNLSVTAIAGLMGGFVAEMGLCAAISPNPGKHAATAIKRPCREMEFRE